MTTNEATTETICEILDCGRESVATMNGVRVCERCRRDLVSVGLGAVRFGGSWHGVRGARYTAKQLSAYPGLRAGA